MCIGIGPGPAGPVLARLPTPKVLPTHTSVWGLIWPFKKIYLVAYYITHTESVLKTQKGIYLSLFEITYQITMLKSFCLL